MELLFYVLGLLISLFLSLPPPLQGASAAALVGGVIYTAGANSVIDGDYRAARKNLEEQWRRRRRGGMVYHLRWVIVGVAVLWVLVKLW